MEYKVGSIGRVIVARFDDGEDFLGSLRDLVTQEQIRAGWFHILGGLRHADAVSGPKEPVMPPDPVWQTVDGAREVLGAGSIFWDGAKPKFHLHSALGHHGETLLGCVRRNTSVYLILEVCILEITGFTATRPFWDKGGFNRLTFQK
ncbi:MAG: DNA-binding protein [Deltaproteobacteria bacterium RIFOXYD12_FULL_50_9]|nr:MAG: DNA-binding protein [Deltaproteobacteria bacterium RIFOXYD12_FULL_50_9]